MDKAETIRDLQERIADAKRRLTAEVAEGNRTIAHDLVDQIVDLQRDLEDLG